MLKIFIKYCLELKRQPGSQSNKKRFALRRYQSQRPSGMENVETECTSKIEANI